MDISAARAQLLPVVARRLGRPAAQVRPLVDAYLSATLAQTVSIVTSAEPPPSTLPATRTVLLERLVNELNRLPSATEVAALLRVRDTAAKTLLSQVLAVSDLARDIALRSVFARAEPTGEVGGSGPIPHGKKWRFTTFADLGLAKAELERTATRFSTQSSSDGNYVLVVDPAFSPPTA